MPTRAIISVSIALVAIAINGVAQAGMPQKEQGPNGHLLVTIGAGKYALGKKGYEFNPAHTAALGTFKIADADPTNAQFAVFIKATGYVTDAERRGFGKTL